MFLEKNLKKIIIGLIVLCALLAGALIYREIDARKVPPLAQESETATPTDTTVLLMPTASPAPTDIAVSVSTTPSPMTTGTPTNTAPPESSLDATTEPITSSSITAKPIAGAYGTITIQKKTFTLKRGIDEKTLSKDIGWMESSAPPGSEGICVIMGHRNTQFRILKDVEKGDTVAITDATGANYTYIVQSARIIEKDSELRFEAEEGKTLVLVTCYPFYFQGHAPHKYVVYATLLDAL